MRLGSKLIISAGCFASLTACPLDERELKGFDVSVNGGTGQGGTGEAGQNDGGDAGSNGGSSATGGSSAQGGTAGSTQGGSGGTSGEAGGGGDAASSTGGGPVGRCPDLDVNGVLDCEETLVTNATFDAGVLPWISEAPTVLVDFSDEDAHDKNGSGSMSIQNTNSGVSLNGANQCVNLTGGKVYNFAVEAMVPEDTPTAQAGMLVNVYSSLACSSDLVENQQSNYIGSGTGWRVISMTYLLPANAKSARIRLVGHKLPGSPSRVYFDNMLVNED